MSVEYADGQFRPDNQECERKNRHEREAVPFALHVTGNQDHPDTRAEQKTRGNQKISRTPADFRGELHRCRRHQQKESRDGRDCQ